MAKPVNKARSAGAKRAADTKRMNKIAQEEQMEELQKMIEELLIENDRLKNPPMCSVSKSMEEVAKDVLTAIRNRHAIDQNRILSLVISEIDIDRINYLEAASKQLKDAEKAMDNFSNICKNY